MLKMNVQMQINTSQLDWLSRPFVKEPETEYSLRFALKIPKYNFYAPQTDLYSPIEGELHRLTSLEEENRIITFEDSCIEGLIKGKDLRRYFLELKKNIEKEVIDIGLDKEYFVIEVNFDVEEFPDMRLY